MQTLTKRKMVLLHQSQAKVDFRISNVIRDKRGTV